MGFVKEVFPYSGIGLAANALKKKKPTDTREMRYDLSGQSSTTAPSLLSRRNI
jgi:hypothetical protein